MNHDIIFIDWDGTLSGSRFWGHWAHDDTHNQAYALIQERFFKASPSILESWMRGDCNAETIVEQVASITQLTPAEVLVGLQESCEAMLLFDDRILKIVADLRAKGVKVVIATDNMDTFTRWTVPALQLDHHFDAISTHTH